MLKAMVVLAVLVSCTSFAGEPQIKLPPGAYSRAGTYTNNNEPEPLVPGVTYAAIYSPSCGQRTKGCLKVGTHQLPYGTLVVHPPKKSK
jgi:hypothetical protein